LKEGRLSYPSSDPDARPLHRIVLEHVSAVVVVGVVLTLLALLLVRHEAEVSKPPDGRIERLLSTPGLDLSRPLHREILRDTYILLNDATDDRADSLLRAIEEARLRLLTDPSRKTGGERQRLTWTVAGELLSMYGVFLIVLVVVIAATYVSARAYALRKFVVYEQGRASSLRQYLRAIESGGMIQCLLRADLPAKAVLHGLGSIVLFSPAYVIAYSLRTRLDTENLLFLILLAIVSNGVLVHSANRLYALLVSESRRGYVQTALVKGLSGDYEWNRPGGIARLALLSPSRIGSSHIFHEIFLNARLQFIPSLKEHVTFIVTGLVIIEMALNIKGHLCYYLLQQILYRQYDIAVAIVFLIFLAVKIAELSIDIWHATELGRYSNGV
jgi:hypothetical protein